MSPARLPPLHLLLALAVVTIWGSNFVVIRLALDHMPPLLFAALRFTFALLPAVFLIPRPRVPWRNLAAYGLLIGAGQFGLLFVAMHGHIAPGIASLVIQTQVFFTIAIAVRLTGERVQRVQWLALALTASGIVVIALHAHGGTTPLGLGMVLAAALCWGLGNTVARATPGVNMLAYVVWASLFSAPPLLLLSLVLEGWPAMREGLVDAGWGGWAAVLWQSLGNTLFGFAAWAWLLGRHPSALVSPIALLVPVVGMTTAWLLLGEPMPAWKQFSALLVIAGLVLGVALPPLLARAGARVAARG